MIPLPSGTKIWLVAGITDMRNGFNGLAAKVQTTLKDDPMSGHVFIFRGRNGSQVKLLWSTGDGLCLLTKRLERGRFAWPSARDGKVFLTPAQLAMLLEGIDWRQPKRGPLGKRKISYVKPVFYTDCYLLSVTNGIFPVPA